MNKKIVHDALILFAFTIVLGLLLGVVYGVTKPSIDKVNEEKKHRMPTNRYLQMQIILQIMQILMQTQHRLC